MSSDSDAGEAGTLIFHIAEVEDWEKAKSSGEYRRSTRGVSLEDEGFIHCSHADQVDAVGQAFYRPEDSLVLLVIDPSRLEAEVREELSGDETFPHIYGPLPVAAVVDVKPFTRPG